MSMKIEKGRDLWLWIGAAARRRVVMTKQCGPIWRLKGADEDVAHVATPTKKAAAAKSSF